MPFIISLITESPLFQKPLFSINISKTGAKAPKAAPTPSPQSHDGYLPSSKVAVLSAKNIAALTIPSDMVSIAFFISSGDTDLLNQL